MIALPAARATRRMVRLLVATEALGYLTLALFVLALLAGGSRAWTAAAAALAATLVCLAFTLQARRAGTGPVGRPVDEEEWPEALSELHDHPTQVVALSAAFLFGVFTLTSTVGALWLDARTWPVPAAYAVTALVALAVWAVARRRHAFRSIRR